jgi:predicted acyltransferase
LDSTQDGHGSWKSGMTMEAAGAEVRTARSSGPVRRDVSHRLASVDALRGLLIAGMIIVNNPGSWDHIHPWLTHSAWNGWRLIDLGFPGFLFVAGISTVFAIDRECERGHDVRWILRRIVRRSLVLIVLGLLLGGFPNYADLAHFRITGILQRIGITYGIAALLYLFTSVRTQVVIAVALLVGYWLLMVLVPVPGHGGGVLEPGLDLSSWIDRLVLGTRHMYRWDGGQWDPESLLGTLPATTSVMAGVFAGVWLRSARSAAVRLRGFVLAGIALVLVALAWSEIFPINKNLWTSSFVLLAAGAGCFAIALSWWLIDLHGHERAAYPLRVFGANAIAAYFALSIVAQATDVLPLGPDETNVREYIYMHVFERFGQVAGSALYSLVFALAGFFLLLILYRKRIFLRI